MSELENGAMPEVTEEVVENYDITFDDILTDKEYQSEFDRRVSKAIETAKGKWQQEAESKRNEAERLAKMNADEKHKYELDKMAKEKEDVMARLNAYELKEVASKLAREKGIDTDLLETIDFSKETAESVKDKLTTLDAIVKRGIEKGINEKLKQKAPVSFSQKEGEKPTFSRHSY